MKNANDLSARELGFSKGETTTQSALEIMQKKELTGIIKDTASFESGVHLDFITADYQSRIHLFKNLKYARSIDFRSDAVLPYGYAVRAASVENRVYLLVLYRDAFAMTNQKIAAAAPTVSVLRFDEASFNEEGKISLKAIEEANEGLTRPVFVGYDLSQGVLLVARNSEGEIWTHGYFFKLKDNALQLDPVPIDQAAQCSCVQKYLTGGVSSLWEE